MNTPDIEAWVCKECEQYGEIRQGSVHNIKAMNCRVKPSDPVFFDTNTPDTEWEKEFEAEFMEYAAENENTLIDSDTDGKRVKQFIRSLLTSRDTYWKERVEEARKEAYAHAEIVRQRTLNDIREAVEADVPYGGAKDCVYVILDNLK